MPAGSGGPEMRRFARKKAAVMRNKKKLREPSNWFLRAHGVKTAAEFHDKFIDPPRGMLTLDDAERSFRNIAGVRKATIRQSGPGLADVYLVLRKWDHRKARAAVDWLVENGCPLFVTVRVRRALIR